MIDSDAYWRFMFNAVTINSSRKYYFDSINKKLFSTENKKGTVTPFYINQNLGWTEEKDTYFADVLLRLEQKDISIIELPKLTFPEMKEFLQSFVDEIENGEIKLILQDDLNKLDETDSFGFKTDLKQFSNSLFMEFDIKRGQFIFKRAEEMLNTLGVSEEIPIIW